MFDRKKLAEIRQEYGVSQNKLAVACGISREYLNRIENGSKVPKEELSYELFFRLSQFNPETPLSMIFDYVRIRFPTTDVRKVVEQFLKIKFDFMLHEDYAFYSYLEQYVFGGITVMFSHDIEKGVLLELKGQGCRQFESFLLAQKRDWYAFFKDCLEFKAVIKRLDLAINDHAGILDIPELVHKCEQEECISVFRGFKNYRSGELTKMHEKLGMGNTLYVGSLKSEVYFCIYEKDYEQYIKLGIPVEENEIKNRFEIRLKNDRAFHALDDLIRYRDIEKTAFSIINRYLRFADKEEEKRRSNWKTNERWMWFIGKNRDELRLTTRPEPYTLERTYRWIGRQVAPSVKMLKVIEKINGTDWLKKIFARAKLSKKQLKIIEQQTTQIEKIIVTE